MSEEPTALRLADEYADAVATHRLESLYGTSKSYTLEKARERDEAHDALTAELRRLHDELKECQDQRRAAFRRIEELDRELDAMRAQIGQGVPDVDDLRVRLVAISSAIADSDDIEAQAIIRTTLDVLASSPPAPQSKPHTA